MVDNTILPENALDLNENESAVAEGRLTSKVVPGFALAPVLLWCEEPLNGTELVELVQRMAGIRAK
jgi:hypothetical protein